MKQARAIIRTVLVLWVMAMPHNMMAMSSSLLVADSAFYRNYPYVRFVDDSLGVDFINDEAFLDMAAKVIFPVNQYELPQQDPVLAELREKVLPRLNRDSVQLLRILFRGAASPDGPYQRNRLLSERRAQSINDYVKSQMAEIAADSTTLVFVEAEDYPLLCVLMKRASDPDYQLVKSLCDDCLNRHQYDELKQRLQAVQQGNLWRRLLNTYFPQLRAARFVLFVKKLAPQLPIAPLQEEAVTITVDEPDTIAAATPMLELMEPDFLLRRELLSVKTNLLLDVAYVPGYNRWCPIPNIAVEYYPLKGHFTFGGSFDMPWWQDFRAHKYFQIRNYQVESRYYFNGANKAYGTNSTNGAYGTNGTYQKAYTGFYLQGYLHGGVFGICFDADRGWVGEGFGGGVGAGYVMPLTKQGRWRLEFGLQVGYIHCNYDPYQYENPVNPAYHDDNYYYKWTLKPELFKKRQYRWNWIGPTRVGITLSYDLLYRRIQRKGMSLKSKERRAEP